MSADPSAQPANDSIQAYFALAFPNFTYYLQTLSVSIGRRAIPPSEGPQVDVDLGPLKSVSRLHANISYDEDAEAFVLDVVGRNGAWVDGEWVASGSKVTLRARTKIQIASRTFQFLLAPSPTAPPTVIPSADAPLIDENMTPVHQSFDIPRSPSVDVVSLSSRDGSPTRSPSPPKPMPPKPAITYATLCYRAIKALGGKASLQEICGWVMREHEWYRRNQGHGWENSIRHNLSSNQAFVKIKRNAKKEKGKGCFWGFDPEFEHLYEDKDKPGPGPKQSKGKQAIPLESRQGGGGAALSNPDPAPTKNKASTKKQQATPASFVPSAPPFKPPLAPPDKQISSTPQPAASSSSVSNVCLPLRVAKVPLESVPAASTSVSGSSSTNPPPIVLHNGELFLNPEIFSHLTQERLEELRLLGAARALEILQGEIVKFLKEKMKAEAKGKGNQGSAGPGTSASKGGGSASSKPRPNNKGKARADVPLSSPLTTKPLVPPQLRHTTANATPTPIIDLSQAHPPTMTEGPAVKKRRLEIGTSSLHTSSAAGPPGPIPGASDGGGLGVSIGV